MTKKQFIKKLSIYTEMVYEEKQKPLFVNPFVSTEKCCECWEELKENVNVSNITNILLNDWMLVYNDDYIKGFRMEFEIWFKNCAVYKSSFYINLFEEDFTTF